MDDSVKVDELHLYMDIESIEHDINRGFIDSAPAQTIVSTWDEIESPRIHIPDCKTRILTVCPNFLSYRYAKDLYIHSEGSMYKLTEVSNI